MAGSNTFQFKHFSVSQSHSALKVGTDAVLLGASAQFGNPDRILDIGTGTGILALMMAQRYPCPVSAIEIDGEAIIDARQNFAASPWHDRITLGHCAIQDFARQTAETFDGIICNPPFFSDSLRNPSQQKTIARHTVALPPNDLFSCIAQLLSRQGTAVIIIPFSEKAIFSESAVSNNLYITKEIHVFPFADSEKPNRAIVFFRKEWEKFQQESIRIREDRTTYSSEYRQLTQEFYIHI